MVVNSQLTGRIFHYSRGVKGCFGIRWTKNGVAEKSSRRDKMTKFKEGSLRALLT